MRICLLASGSKGNACYVEAGATRLLFDAGVPLRTLRERLATIDVAPEQLDAVFMSHAHNDHCRGLGPLCRKTGVALHTAPAALRQAEPLLGKIPKLREFDAGETLDLRDVRITTIPLTHDAEATVGFVVESQSGKVGIATDLGIATRLVAQQLSGCRALVLEFNHDEELLRDGPYPWPLKQRIRSKHGHLSNHEAAELLDSLVWDGLEAVFLAHLSETNNTPHLAESTARAVLARQHRCAPEVILGWQQQASTCFSTIV